MAPAPPRPTTEMRGWVGDVRPDLMEIFFVAWGAGFFGGTDVLLVIFLVSSVIYVIGLSRVAGIPS